MVRTKVIKPGVPVRNSKSGQPIMAVLDLLGRRWALRILWSLRGGDPKNFRVLQKKCGITSPNVLVARLRELQEAGVIEVEESGGYALTLLGSSLLEALGPLAGWADRWAVLTGREDLACYSQAQQDERGIDV